MDPDNVTEEVIDNGPSADDLAALDSIAEIGKEFQAVFDAEPPEEEQKATADDGVPSEEVVTPPAELKPEVPEPKPEDRGLERIVAREVELRQKEEAFKVREARIAQVEAENAELRTRVEAFPTDFVGQLSRSPTAAIKAAGQDPAHVVRLLLAEDLRAQGKEIPPQLQAQIEKAENENRYRTLENELRSYQQHQAAQAFVAQVEHGAQQYVTTGISKDAPTVAEVAKANPVRVYNEIMDEIRNDAASRVGKDPTAAVLSYEEAAKRVEKRWTEFRSLFGPPTASTPAPNTPAPTVKTQERPPTSAPPAKPIQARKPTADELMEEGIKAGVTEYRRVASPRPQ